MCEPLQEGILRIWIVKLERVHVCVHTSRLAVLPSNPSFELPTMEQSATLPSSMEDSDVSDVPLWTQLHEEECIMPAVQRLWNGHNRGAFAERDVSDSRIANSRSQREGHQGQMVQDELDSAHDASIMSPPFAGLLSSPVDPDPDPPTTESMLGTLHRLEELLVRNVQLTQNSLEQSLRLLQHVHDTARSDIRCLRDYINRSATRASGAPTTSKTHKRKLSPDTKISQGLSQRKISSKGAESLRTHDTARSFAKGSRPPVGAKILVNSLLISSLEWERRFNSLFGASKPNGKDEGPLNEPSTHGVSEISNGTDDGHQQHNVVEDDGDTHCLTPSRPQKRLKVSSSDHPLVQSSHSSTSEHRPDPVMLANRKDVRPLCSPDLTVSSSACEARDRDPGSTQNLFKPAGGGEGYM